MDEGKALEAYIKEQKVSKTKLAADLKMSRQNLYQIFESKTLSLETIQKFEKALNTHLEKIFRVNVDNSKKPYNEGRLERKNNAVKKNAIPFYDTEATASDVDIELTPISAPAGTIDIGDLLHDSQAAIRIYGNSMLPNYPPGCVVGLVKTTDAFIQPGEVYVIETNEQRLLKRLFYKEDDPDSEVITCYSDNVMKFEGGSRSGKSAYPPFNLPKKDIKKLFIVTGVIKRNTNSIIINRN